ncbi:MAG: class I SAM-dependent rRNA methyltransferase [Acidobacteria bacterium]|nr:class I SAM-dependent rRNA methyltransferase [Acidobacteriota bacterium]
MVLPADSSFDAFSAAEFARSLQAALRQRGPLVDRPDLTAYRVLDGAGDNAPGVSIDRYGAAAVLNVHDDLRLSHAAVTEMAAVVLDVLAPGGVAAVYVKAFARDRSRRGGDLPGEASVATPRAGVVLPETLVVTEYDTRFEVRPYDGLSTGLFLDHREHRQALAARRPHRALNLFAYTCAFAVPLAAAGAAVTNVDVSGRYLEWGRRNLALNGLEASPMRFLRRHAMEFLSQAARRPDERFDLVILDPPTFGAANRRRGVDAWRAVDDYPALVAAAVGVLSPRGVVFAASNTRELAAAGALRAVVSAALTRAPRWLPLPPWPLDVREPNRVAAVLFAP